MTQPQDLPTDPDFARRVERCEIEAWLDLDSSEPGARQFEFQTIDGAILMLDRSPNWPHSLILNLGIGRAVTNESIQELLRRTREAGITTLTTDISPIARPGTLARMLSAQGFRQTERNVTVARNTAAMPQPDGYFRIRSAEESDKPGIIDLMRRTIPGAEDWYVTLANQTNKPNWRHTVATENNAISAIAAFHIFEDMAWLSPIWVSPEFRNRGTQAALIAHSVREAASNGVSWVITSYPATLPGRTRNFERLGFSIVYLRNRFVWNPAGS
jgi:N-acetylglutamate synthase-like GNAT family acetyltransferase